MLIPVRNFEKCTVDLPSNVQLGVVEPFEEICDTPDSVSPSVCAKVLVDGPGYHEKERPYRLFNLLDLSEFDCSSEQLDTLKALLSQHTDIFEMDSSELGNSNVVQHVINTGDSAPIKQHPYRTPIAQRERIAQLIKQMEEQGIVKPSCSPWASPVLVPKKDGSTHFCVDYRHLNSVMKDVYPLPHIDDILDTLGRAKIMNCQVGDRVMVHMPHEVTEKIAKLARPYFGPYRVLNLTPTNAEVRLIDKPDDPSIFVSLDRVRPCYSELPSRSWSGHTSKRKRKRKSSAKTETVKEPSPELTPYTGPITRSCAKANN